jgi:hypothetical protein
MRASASVVAYVAADYAVTFTLKSRNEKVGPMPVSTTSRETCPDSCPLKDSGCYAESGNVAMLWRALSQTKPGKKFTRGAQKIQSLTWSQFCAKVAALKPGTIWRHNQAGDLPGQGDAIDVGALGELIGANYGRRGFTYTHKPITGPHGARNARAIRSANLQGFTVNLSADNLLEADQLAESGVGPVVVVLPDTVQGNADISTPAGRRVSVCPATYRDDVSCATCQLCQRQNRKSIVGFPAHGASKRKASAVAQD